METVTPDDYFSLRTDFGAIFENGLVRINDNESRSTPRYWVSNYPHLMARRVEYTDFDELCQTAAIFNDLPLYGVPSLPYIPIKHDTESYILTLKVEGENFENMLSRSAVPSEMIDEIDVVWANLASYLLFSYKNHAPSAADIYGPNQYMYGTIAGSDVPQLWMVDLDKYIDIFKSEEDKKGIPSDMLYYEYEGEVLDLINNVLKIEAYLDLPLSLSRQALLQNIDQIADNYLVSAFKNALENSKWLDPNVYFPGH